MVGQWVTKANSTETGPSLKSDTPETLAMATATAAVAVVGTELEWVLSGADGSPMDGGGMAKASPCGLRRRLGLPLDLGDAGAARRAGASSLVAVPPVAAETAGSAATPRRPSRGDPDGECRCDGCDGCDDDGWDVACFWCVERAACEARAESMDGDNMAAVDAAGAGAERGGVANFSDFSRATRGGVLNFSVVGAATVAAAESMGLSANGRVTAGMNWVGGTGRGDENSGVGNALVSAANDDAGVAKVGDARYT